MMHNMFNTLVVTKSLGGTDRLCRMSDEFIAAC
jgi:hypothetical protein